MFGHRRSLLDQGLDAFAQKRWKRARALLEESALEEQSAVGDYHLGLLYWRGLGGPRDAVDATVCFQHAAEAGHAAAQTALALALRAGVGIARNDEAARLLLRSAAGAGDVEAMTHLASMSDEDEARRLYERAAEAGHSRAMHYLSDMLLPTDPVEALAWLYVSVGLHSEKACAQRAKSLARELTASEIARAQKQGRLLLKRLRAESAYA